MRQRFLIPCIVVLLAASVTVRADQDDIDNNADLQPTPEERAHAAVVKRWPDATEIDALDMTADGPPDEDKQDMPAAPANDWDDADDGKKAEKPDDMAADDKNEKDDDDADEMADWTISVMFKSGGKDFEALTNDDGKIQYIYETIPNEKAPENIVAAARDAAKDGDLIYVQKVTDESNEKPTESYIVGIGLRDVMLDMDGKVLKVKDVPNDADKDDDDAPDDGTKIRI